MRRHPNFTSTYHWVNAHWCLKCESAIRRFQPREGPTSTRVLLHDCEIFAYLRITFVSRWRWCWCGALLSGDIGGVTVENSGPLLASAGSWSPVWPGAGLPVTPPSVAHQLLSGPQVTYTYTYIYQLFYLSHPSFQSKNMLTTAFIQSPFMR